MDFKTCCLGGCCVLLLFPLAALADLTQTATLSTSGSTNLNLDTGAIAGSGGDIQLGDNGITPQGTAKAVNLGLQTAASFNGFSSTVAQFYPGYSAATIPTATLQNKAGSLTDAFLVHTNGGHYAKVLVTSFTNSTISLTFTTFGVTSNDGPGPPTITAILNNSSNISFGLPNYGIAPSSIFVVMGTGLADPGTPVLQSSASPGLPLTLNGASISATVNGVTVHPAIYYTSPKQIAGVLPASTPVGTGTLTVTYNGVASNAATLQVVPAALGINTFYTNSAVATDAITGALIDFTNSAVPGEVLTLWTTGLGADPADSDTVYTTTPHAVNTPLQIYIGGTPAGILYQGSAGYPGVNQINLTVPQAAPDGCWIGILALSNGMVGNVATIPVNHAGGGCFDPVNGVTGAQVTPSSQSWRTGLVDIGQSTTTNAKNVTTISTFSDAAFETYTGSYTPANSVSPGSCLVGMVTAAASLTLTGLDPGSIRLTGPGGISQTMASQFGIKGAFAASLADGAIPDAGGTFTFTGTGGADVGSFTTSVTFASPILNWTNQNAVSTVDRSKDLTVTWTGGNPGSYVEIDGTSIVRQNNAPVSTRFVCLAKVDAGQFTIPSYILSGLFAGTGSIELFNDVYQPFSTSGIDIGIALGQISFIQATTFK